jgi:hypothetical protein
MIRLQQLERRRLSPKSISFYSVPCIALNRSGLLPFSHLFLDTNMPGLESGK